MPKGDNPNSRKNLKPPFSADKPEIARECQKKAIAAYYKNKAERLQRSDMLDYLFYKLVEKDLLDKAIENAEGKAADGDNKDLNEILKLVKPNENQNLNVSMDVQKTFASTKEIKEAVKHIKSIIK